MKASIRIVCLILSIVLILSSCARDVKNAEGDEDVSEKYSDCVRLTMPLIFYSDIPRDIGLIEDALNEITSEKIGVVVELVAVQDSTRRSDIQMLKNEGKHLDLINNFTTGEESIPLDELLNEYGQGILETLEEYELELGKVDGVQYRLKARADSASLGCVYMRKDILDKYGIDPSSIETWRDYDELLELLSEREKGMYLVSPFRTSQNFFTRFTYWDTLAASAFVLMDGGQSDKVELLFETELYNESVRRFYTWHKNGWTPAEMDMNDISSADLVKAGKLFSYFGPYYPGMENQESRRCNTEMAAVCFNEAFLPNGTGNSIKWGISAECTEPEAAMRLLNLLYTDPEPANLLNYGIEGLHYEVNDEGFACYPEGIDSDNCGYSPNIGWELPNQYLCYVWEGDPPTHWEDIEKFNTTAKVSKAHGFSFDAEPVESEVNEIRSIVLQYSTGLSRGEYNPDKVLPEMLEKIKNAGGDTVREEVQRQFDEWRQKEAAQ